MSKIFSPDPIFIQNLEELKKIENDFQGNQYIQFICTQCGKVYKRRLTRLREMKFSFLCKGCIRKNLFTDPLFKSKYIESVTQSSLKKYGTPHPSQSVQVKEKFKQTCLEKYGVENLSQSKMIKKRLVENNIKKYGVEYPSQLQEVKEKVKQTCLEKYGTLSTSQIPEVKEKAKQTWIEKYGVEHPNKNKEVRKKAKQTCLEKYGVENPSQLQEVKEKKKQTYLEHFGVDHVWKLPEMKKKIKEKSRQTWSQKTPEELKLIRSKSVKKYIYENQSFDSSWELAVWIWAKALKKNIIREPIGLKYEFESEEHTYYPDFEIDGRLIEIKGDQFFKEDGTMCNPYDSSKDPLFEAKHQCGLRHGVEFWSEKEMQPILEYVSKNTSCFKKSIIT